MINKQKKLMVLGAGIFQLPIIKHAVENGYYVITVDNVPNNIGHKYSHKYINASTTDQETILEKAKILEIDGITTLGSDVALPSLAYVGDKLALNAPRPQTVETMIDKARFRKFQQEKGLNSLQFVESSTIDDLGYHLDRLTYPLVFKPVDTSGSRGVIKVETSYEKETIDAFNKAMSFSKQGRICIEEFVQGEHISGDGFIFNGKLACCYITKKYRDEFIVLGHSLPSSLSVINCNKVIEEVNRTCVKSNYTTGPLDFDAVISKKGVYLIEITPRLGGNGIPEIIKIGSGTDLIDATIRYSLGLLDEAPKTQEVSQSCGSMVFGSVIDGTLSSIANEKSLRELAPEIVSYYSNSNPGNKLNALSHGGNAMGYFTFKLSDQALYQDVREKIYRALDIKLEEI